MNQIRISGILGEVEERTSGKGVRVASARLQFNREGESILVVAVDARTRQLTVFSKGEHVRVIGRLAVYGEVFAVLVDECGRWASANRGKFAYDESKAQRSIREAGQDFPMG
jgi:hypothetical protein